MSILENINPAQTVCFTGHRPGRLPSGAGEQIRMTARLADEIEAAVGRGKVSFISGCMSGFDTLAAEQVLRLKGQYPHIQCVLIAPFSAGFFRGQNWSAEWESRLRAVIRQADVAVSLSERAYKGVYFERDRVMVGLSSEVIAYYDGGAGGTRYTLEFARRQGMAVVNIFA